MQSGGLTGSGHFLGTPNYTAPEQITGQAVDGRTDQYALACAAFELLAGRVPFADREGWAAIWAQMNDPTPTLTDHRPDLPFAVNEVFARAMAKAPGSRYGSCQQFTMLAVGDSNGRVYLWNLSAGKLTARKPVATLINPGGPVTSLLTGENRTAVFSVAFSPDGTTLATSDTNGRAYLWQVR